MLKKRLLCVVILNLMWTNQVRAILDWAIKGNGSGLALNFLSGAHFHWTLKDK